jgi:hypothetical protein
MGLYDERVAALRSTAMKLDMTHVAFLDFDVLAAPAAMDGREMPDLPLFDSNAQVEEFAAVVEDYSRRIDRIWNFVGGISVGGLERLAIWTIRNRDRAGTLWHHIGAICPAFVYGERELAHELIAELRSQWEERVQLEPRDVIFEVYDGVRQDLERLQEAVRKPTVH